MLQGSWHATFLQQKLQLKCRRGVICRMCVERLHLLGEQAGTAKGKDNPNAASIFMKFRQQLLGRELHLNGVRG